jgi:MarR family transcriptional regulator for hemolysin
VQSAAFSDLGFLSNRLARLLRMHLSREAAPVGLTATQVAVVLTLGGPDRRTMSDLAGRIGIDRPTMTGVVERLVRDGWLDSSPNPADGRSRLVGLTARGLASLPDLAEASARTTQSASIGLSDQERAMLVSLLDRAAKNLEHDLADRLLTHSEGPR